MEKIAIIGSGLIGRAWAMVFARAGHPVKMYDAAPGAVEKALDLIDEGLAELKNAGLIEEAPAAIMKRVAAAQSLEEAVGEADYVKEALDRTGKVDFWIEPLGPLGETREYTLALLQNSNIPIAFGTKLYSMKNGALMHITPNPEASARETTLMADKILKGKNPGQIPVTPPSKFDLGFNLTTALKLGIVIPPDMLRLAGENVYL